MQPRRTGGSASETHDDIGRIPRRRDVLSKILEVYVDPNHLEDGQALVGRHCVERVRSIERRNPLDARQIARTRNIEVGIQKHFEVKVSGNFRRESNNAFEDEDAARTNRYFRADDIVGAMVVNGNANRLTRAQHLDVRDKAHKVKALRKPLPVHQPRRLQHGVRLQIAVERNCLRRQAIATELSDKLLGKGRLARRNPAANTGKKRRGALCAARDK
jgi:hypothetical protein